MSDRQESLDPGLRCKRGVLSDRRAAPRFQAFGTAVEIGWWSGPEFRNAVGMLKDISRGGAAALAEASPPQGTTIFFRLTGTRLTEWVEAEIVEVTKTRWFRRVPRLVRMKFAEPCPYHIFQAAIDVLVMDCQFLAPESPRSKGGRAGRRRDPRTLDRRPGSDLKS